MSDPVADIDDKEIDFLAVFRITSYNVCYTKLLRLFPPRHWIRRSRRALFGDYRFTGHYKSHPDPRQEQFFFGLVRECLDKGVFGEDLLREEMAKNHLRHDALEVLKRTPPLAA